MFVAEVFTARRESSPRSRRPWRASRCSSTATSTISRNRPYNVGGAEDVMRKAKDLEAEA
ncbi:MAG: hypothetical protein R2789_11510 [Microthrixaceae bacterium]